MMDAAWLWTPVNLKRITNVLGAAKLTKALHHA
jgi:hypothetical protein